jgi:hypothetical protein
MFVATSEAAVNLADLDPHLKAILKTRIREFIYLHPCFAYLSAAMDISQVAELGEELASGNQETERVSLETARAKLQLERLYRAGESLVR